MVRYQNIVQFTFLIFLVYNFLSKCLNHVDITFYFLVFSEHLQLLYHNVNCFTILKGSLSFPNCPKETKFGPASVRLLDQLSGLTKPNSNEKCANKWKHVSLEWYNSVKSTVVLARLDTQPSFSERKMSRIWGGLKLNAPVSVVQHTNWIQQVNSFKLKEKC